MRLARSKRQSTAAPVELPEVSDSVVLAVGSVFYLRKANLARPALFGTALGLVVGGALGNAIDRLVYGRVTDFVVWYAVGRP